MAIVKSRNDVAKLLISELGPKGMGAVADTGITAAHVAASSGEMNILDISLSIIITLTVFMVQSGNIEVLKIIATKNKKLLSLATVDGKIL